MSSNSQTEMGLLLGACHLYALTLNPSPNLGRGTLSGFSPLLPILEKLVLSLSKGVGDEGNKGFANVTCSLAACVFGVCLSELSMRVSPADSHSSHFH